MITFITLNKGGFVTPIILTYQVFYPRKLKFTPVFPIFFKLKTIATHLWYEYKAYVTCTHSYCHKRLFVKRHLTRSNKGQSISECLFGVSKNIKSGQINKRKALSYNIIHQIAHIIICKLKYYKEVSLFCWFDHFLDSWAEICQIFRVFFWKIYDTKKTFWN